MQAVGGRRSNAGGHTLGSEELAGDVEGFAADDDDLLAIEQLLCDCAGEATEKVPLAIFAWNISLCYGSHMI